MRDLDIAVVIRAIAAVDPVRRRLQHRVCGPGHELAATQGTVTPLLLLPFAQDQGNEVRNVRSTSQRISFDGLLAATFDTLADEGRHPKGFLLNCPLNVWAETVTKAEILNYAFPQIQLQRLRLQGHDRVTFDAKGFDNSTTISDFGQRTICDGDDIMGMRIRRTNYIGGTNDSH
jgi:hypothetical protein